MKRHDARTPESNRLICGQHRLRAGPTDVVRISCNGI